MGCDVERALARVVAVVQHEVYRDEHQAFLQSNFESTDQDPGKAHLSSEQILESDDLINPGMVVDSDDSIDKAWSLSSSEASTCFNISDFSTEAPYSTPNKTSLARAPDVMLPSLLESSPVREELVRSGVDDRYAGAKKDALEKRLHAHQRAPPRQPEPAVIEEREWDEQLGVGTSTVPHLVLNSKGRLVWRADSRKGKGDNKSP